MSTSNSGTPPVASSGHLSTSSSVCSPSADTVSSPASNSSSTPGSSNSSPGLERISKYLVQYVPATPKRTKGDSKRVIGERVLTSSEGLAILKEKEDKKRREAEEKQKRKDEREQKKKEKEELAKKKAEARAKKTSSQRLAPKRVATSQPKVRTKKAKPDSASTHTAPSSTNLAIASVSASTNSTAASTSTSASMSTGECCECFETYEDDVRFGRGEEWVECACGRWIHEKCIDKLVIDAQGKEKFCSFCVV